MNRAVWIFMLSFVIGFVLTMQTAHATIQSLGKIGGNMWSYDDSTITDNDNITGVWIVTNNKLYNIEHDKNYALFGVYMLLDCIGHQYAIDKVDIIGSDKRVLHEIKIDHARFSDPKDDTIPARLLKLACGITG